MLIIRRAQMEAFERNATSAFTEYAEDELRSRWEKRYAALEPEALTTLIRRASVMAARFDLVYYADVCRCAELLLAFGVNFPAGTSWATDLLERAAASAPPEQFEALWQRALQEREFAAAVREPPLQTAEL